MVGDDSKVEVESKLWVDTGEPIAFLSGWDGPQAAPNADPGKTEGSCQGTIANAAKTTPTKRFFRTKTQARPPTRLQGSVGTIWAPGRGRVRVKKL